MAPSTTYTSKEKGKRAKLFLLSVVIGALTLVTSADVFIGGSIRFYSKWIECGQKPLATANAYKGPSYYFEAPAVSLVRGQMPFFCTSLDAELARYSATSKDYSYPAIDKAYPDKEQTGVPDMQDLYDVSRDRDKLSDQMDSTASVIFIIGTVLTILFYVMSRRIKV